ncbi:MAG: hypothetical protein ACRYFZ_09630 [Janthinobacterium lividum]
MTTAEYKALGTKKKPATPTNHPKQPDVADTPNERGTGKKKEPADKQVQLPPPPKDAGPWRAGPWTIRRATAYPEEARVVATARAEDFPHFLAYLLAYQP